MNLFKLLLITFVVSQSLSSAVAFAGNGEFDYWKKIAAENAPLSQALQKRALYSVELLLQQGHTHVGQFDLKKLRTEILEVQWMTVTDHPIAAGPGGNRSAGTYSVKEKLVIVSLPELKDLEQAPQMQLLLHEALGALGYRDENYNISVAISAVSTMAESKKFNHLPDSQLVQKALPNLNLRVSADRIMTDTSQTKNTPTYSLPKKIDGANMIQKSGGGITGIGGGGDKYSSTIKLGVATVFMYVWESLDHEGLNFDEVFSAVLAADFERTENITSSHGEALIKDTQVSLDQKGLHVVVARNPILTKVNQYETAGHYIAYICTEIIEVFKKRSNP